MQEICERQGVPDGPVLYGKERNRFDINQGDIGDCWFLAALANLADNEQALARVVPGGQGFGAEQYIGAFRFCFYRFHITYLIDYLVFNAAMPRFGCWYEVVVDDLLPTRNNKLLYLKAEEPNEFWTPLLEKAYAKFYGSYQALESGTAIESAVDFTGGIPEYIDISEDIQTQDVQEIFVNLLRAYESHNFLSCSMAVCSMYVWML